MLIDAPKGEVTGARFKMGHQAQAVSWCMLVQAKLHDLLTEKNREAKANMDAASRFMDTGNRSTAPRRDDDLYKVGRFCRELQPCPAIGSWKTASRARFVRWIP